MINELMHTSGITYGMRIQFSWRKIEFKDKRIENAVVKLGSETVVQDKQLIYSFLNSIYESTEDLGDSN